jgi:hypothetical protein
MHELEALDMKFQVSVGHGGVNSDAGGEVEAPASFGAPRMLGYHPPCCRFSVLNTPSVCNLLS